MTRVERGLLVQQLDDVFAHLVEAHPLFHEDGRRHRALFAQDAEQQVFGADVVVQEPIGFFGGVLQHALGFGAERESRPRSRPSRGRPCGLRCPCGCFRGTGGIGRRSGSSGPCLHESDPAASARSRSRCFRAGSLRSGQRTAPAWLVRYTARTSAAAAPFVDIIRPNGAFYTFAIPLSCGKTVTSEFWIAASGWCTIAPSDGCHTRNANCRRQLRDGTPSSGRDGCPSRRVCR